MKLTEQDLQSACGYIVEQTCKAVYGVDYKEKGLKFDIRSTPFTVRMSVDFFIEWLKKHVQEQKGK